MLVHEARVGMKVVFGRGNGEQTLGEIVKVNPTKAKVKTLESRGKGGGSAPGTVWTVPYSLMKPAEVGFMDEYLSMTPVPLGAPGVAKMAAIVDLPVRTHTRGDECIMEAIVDCYTRLEPEFLTADGERPMNEVRQLKHSLESRLSHLFKALGRPVSEFSAFRWSDERKKEAV